MRCSRVNSRLTARAHSIIQAIIEGKRNKEIAFDLGLSENTIKLYVYRIGQRLGVSGRLAIADWGRAYSESRRRISERYQELFPDSPPERPAFNVGIAEYDVLRAMLPKMTLSAHQIFEVVTIIAPHLTEEKCYELALLMAKKVKVNDKRST